MKDFAKSIVCNTKVGNALKYTNLEEAKRMCQQMNDSLAPDAALRHYRHVYEKDGAYYVMETGEATAKGMKRVGNSKIGNRTASEIEKEIAEVESSIDSYHRAGENPPKTLEDRLKKLQAELANAKTGNSTEKLFHGLSKDAEKEEEKSDKALDELKKTGNETYQHKLYPDKYVIIEGKNYKIVTDGKVEKTGELTDAVLYGINQTYKRVGNASSEYEILKQDPSKMHPMYKKAYEEALKKLAREDEGFKKRFEKEYGVKAKNEASDDKFAYVMREFEEGKLKTPDGKVVTDPAQAKAIAYSESKKTENGLARARNAMNPVIYKGYTIRYRPNTGKYYISSGPNDTYVAKFAYKEYSSEQDAKDAIDGSR